MKGDSVLSTFGESERRTRALHGVHDIKLCNTYFNKVF